MQITVQWVAVCPGIPLHRIYNLSGKCVECVKVLIGYGALVISSLTCWHTVCSKHEYLFHQVLLIWEVEATMLTVPGVVKYIAEQNLQWPQKF